MIALANYVDKDVWINIPVAADSLYVVELARLFKNGLRTSTFTLNIPMKCGDAGDFSDYHYNYAAVLNAAEDADIRNSTPWDDRRRARRAARQVIKAGKIFEQVFGITVASHGRIRPVFAWQAAYLPWYDDVLSWVNTAYGPPKNFLYAVSTAPCWSGIPRYQRLGHGRNRRFHANGQRSGARSVHSVHCRTCPPIWTKTCWIRKRPGYEWRRESGEPAYLITANRIPAMKEAVKHHYTENWFSANANGMAPQGTNALINYFAYTGYVSRYGCWGALEDLSPLIQRGLFFHPSTRLCANSAASVLIAQRLWLSPGGLNTLALFTPVQIEATANRPDGSVQFVEFFAGTDWIGTDSITPFSVIWTPVDSDFSHIGKSG